ncbi:hypothetical protein [Methanolobus sp. WCC5]|uniref:hypothetical protein n=1 Tax=Methanolobus sp. WCC5 TaxID=3125785 RepID=UPI0032494F7F
MPAEKLSVLKLLPLLFILLILTAQASAGGIREEDIWIFQGSYELGTGERAHLEGFTVKIHEINANETYSTLLIYRNGVFKEAFRADTGLNNEHTYNNELKIDILTITPEKVSIDVYKQKSELVWITDIPRTAFKAGDTLTAENYKLTVAGISEDGAHIKVQFGSDIHDRNYQSGEYQKISDDFMINVLYLKRETGEVFIETLKPGSPGIKIDVANLKTIYEPDEYIEYELIVTNNGTIPLHGIILNVECEQGSVSQEKQQHSILEPGKMKKFNIKIEPYNHPVGGSISIRSNVLGYDYRANEYSAGTTTETSIKPYISIKKEIISMKGSSSEPESGIEEYFNVKITIQNKADSRKAVTVTDELPASFIPDNLRDTEWAILLEPGSTTTIEYSTSPTEPGEFTFSPATVVWKDEGKTYMLESERNDMTFHVSGPDILVEKELSSSYMLVGEEIAINIWISNQGDRNLKASFRERIPNELTFIEGDDGWEGTIEAGTTKEFSYVVRAERAGEHYLPETELIFEDGNGRMGRATSYEPFLYIDDAISEEENAYIDGQGYEHDIEPFGSHPGTGAENSEITRVQAAGFLASSFAALFSLIAVVPVFAYLYITRVYK